ncbi:MAG: CPXCG motif-containing cysteine-rich protein [Nitrospiria bacterium]
MDSTNTTWVDCPYCGTRIEIVIDCTIPFQEYIEDCEVCCRPIVLAVSVNDDETISVDARDENER